MPHAVRFVVRADRAIAPTGAPSSLYIVCSISPLAEPVESERPRLCTVLALDTSRSMSGSPLEHVIGSVAGLVELLQPDDRLGIVAFSGGATSVLPVTLMDSAGKHLAITRARRLTPSARTNIEAGLLVSATLLDEVGALEGTRRGVILLSDGEPNVGASGPDALRALAASLRPRASVSVLGYGPHHHEDILLAVAEGGGGTYNYVPDPIVCQPFFAQAIGAQVDVVADAVEVVLLPKPGVEIIRVLGGGESRVSAAGVVVPMQDIAALTDRHLVVEAKVDPSKLQRGALATVTLRYRRARDQVSLELSADPEVDLRDPPGPPSAEPHERALFAQADAVRRDARAQADRGNFAIAGALIRPFMAKVAAAPGYFVGAGGLFELHEQLLDDATAYERNPDAELYNRFRKTHSTTSVFDGINAAAVPSSRFSQSLVEATSGQLPAARLVVIRGPTKGAAFTLGVRATIGRAPSAEVAVVAADVSRKHAEVFGADNSYWLRDLGSTNPTLLNDHALGRTPVRLESGDVIGVGAVRIRYEEGGPHPVEASDPSDDAKGRLN